MYKYIQILCISTVARLKCVYLKPFLPLLYSLLMLAQYVSANYTLLDPRLQKHDWLKPV